MATTTDARPWPLTLDRWHAMLAAGILAEDDRVELVEGMLVEVPPPLPQHQSPIDVLTRHFGRVAQDDWLVRVHKARLYARADIPEHWVVDVPGRRVEVRTRPQDGEFRDLRTYGVDEAVAAGTVDAPPLPVASLFA